VARRGPLAAIHVGPRVNASRGTARYALLLDASRPSNDVVPSLPCSRDSPPSPHRSDAEPQRLALRRIKRRVGLLDHPLPSPAQEQATAAPPRGSARGRCTGTQTLCLPLHSEGGRPIRVARTLSEGGRRSVAVGSVAVCCERIGVQVVKFDGREGSSRARTYPASGVLRTDAERRRPRTLRIRKPLLSRRAIRSWDKADALDFDGGTQWDGDDFHHRPRRVRLTHHRLHAVATLGSSAMSSRNTVALTIDARSLPAAPRIAPRLRSACQLRRECPRRRPCLSLDRCRRSPPCTPDLPR
jgi:hypothetical protein